MTRTNIMLDDDTLRTLTDLEAATGASWSEHVRRAVAMYGPTVLAAGTNLQRAIATARTKRQRMDAALKVAKELRRKKKQ